MWKVDSTIDAGGSSPVAERMLERWTYDRGSVRFFRSSANFLYAFQTKGKHHFLRFADSSERGREAIEGEIELLRWLARAGIDVALPVVSTLGNLIETVDTDWGEFHAVVFPALVGEQLEIGDLDESKFRRWGQRWAGCTSRWTRTRVLERQRDLLGRTTWRSSGSTCPKTPPLCATSSRNSRPRSPT
jgi:Ser/Thr protein kinase RdoA (MazF antagonist)